MNLGAPEILLILVVALLVFGPHRLPEIGRQVGGAMRELRRMQDSVKSELQTVINEPAPTYEKPKSAEVAASAIDDVPPVTPSAAPPPSTPDPGDDEPDHTDAPAAGTNGPVAGTDPPAGFDGPSGSFR